MGGCKFYIDSSSLPEGANSPLDFVIVCDGPKSSRCTCIGPNCVHVRDVIGLDYDCGYDFVVEKRLYAITDRWCCMSDCGIHTRLYVTPSYDLLFIHSAVGYDGAHLVLLDDIGRNIIRAWIEKHPSLDPFPRS